MKTILIVVAFMFFGFIITFPLMITHVENITITNIEQVACKNGTKKFVYANGSTYEVADSWPDLQFYSRDLFGKLLIGHTYKVRTRGIRFGFMSMQPNIVKIYQEIKQIDQGNK